MTWFRRIAYSVCVIIIAAGALGYSPETVFRWINVLSAEYSLVSDENDSVSCYWSTTQLTCPFKTFYSTDAGKTIAIDHAGPSWTAYVSTFGSFVSQHVMNLTTPPTTTIAQGTALIHVTSYGPPTTGGIGYLVGDTFKLNCGVGCSQVAGAGAQSTGVVNEITFDATLPTTVAGHFGTGGPVSTSCYVVGTTGYALSGFFIQVNVTTGTDGSLNPANGATIVSYNNANASFYTTNMTTPAAEPVGAGSCTGLTGAQLNFAPGGIPVFTIQNDQANDTTTGFYSAITCGTIPYSTTATSGVGTGMTTLCGTIQAAARWGTDNTAGFTKVMQASNAQSAIPNPYKIYVPAGKYLSKPLNSPITGFGCLEGDAQFHSTIFLIPNYGGDFFSTFDSNNNQSDQSQGGTVSYSTDPVLNVNGPEQAGGCVRHISIIGMRSTSVVQNGVMFYGPTDWMHIEDYQGFYIRGRCLGVGADNTLVNGGRGSWRESDARDNRCENSGDVGIPSVDIVGMGHIYGPNNLHIFNWRIFDSHGPGIAIRSCTDLDSAHLITFDATHIEQSGMSGTTAVGDNLQLGDVNCLSESFPIVGGGSFTPSNSTLPGVTGVHGSSNNFNNVVAGSAAIHIYGGNNSPNRNIIMTGNIGTAGGAPGGGVWFDGGGKSSFHFSSNGTNDYQFRAGTSAGSTNISPGVTYDCMYSGCSVTTFVENDALPSGPDAISFPVYSNNPGHPQPPLWVGTQAVTNSFPNSSPMGMYGNGIGATRLGNNGAAVGTTFIFRSTGVLSTAGTPGTLEFTLLMQGIPFADIVLTPTASMVNKGFNIQVLCTVYTAGPSGTMFCGGLFIVGSSVGQSTTTFNFGNQATAIAYDTTNQGVIAYKTIWATPASGDSVTVQDTVIQLLN